MRTVVVGTAGHIDHGKSTLVRSLTGTDPDRLKEEKDRGITIDLGFAHYVHGDTAYSFVDVPGHERFVKNMLAGASGIDLVLLVIAADESVMPQSREHFDICRLLRVRGGVIALSKADLADADMLELARLELRELVEGTFLERAPVVAVSAKTADGLAELKAALAEAADAVATRRSDGPARLPIDRVFSIRGFGTVVTGTLVSGRIGVDQELELLPGPRRVKARGVQVHGQSSGGAVAGQRVALNLGGLERDEVRRGSTLGDVGCFEPTRRFDATLDLLPGARPLRHGARIRFHQGTSELLGRVSVQGLCREEPAPAEPPLAAPGAEIPPGERAYVRIRLEAPAVLTRGDRYIVRAYSPAVTIAGGEVLDPHPPRGGIRTPGARVRFERLDADRHGQAPDEAVALMVEESGGRGLPVAQLTPRAGLGRGAADRLVGNLADGGRVVRVADLLVDPRLLARSSEQLLAELRAYHRQHPLSDGLPREEARERLFGRAAPAVFDWVVADLQAANRITARDRLALASHQLSLSPDEARARDVIEQCYAAAGLRPPDPSSLDQTVGIAADVVARIMQLLIRQKTLVKVDTLVFHSTALEQLKSEVRGLKAGGAAEVRVNVASFKDRFGVTRKYAIPLLEFLDRERITRRVGDWRIVI